MHLGALVKSQKQAERIHLGLRCLGKSVKSLILAGKTNMLLFMQAPQHLIHATEVKMKWTLHLFLITPALISPLSAVFLPLSLPSSNPSLTRHLGLDLVPRKEFEMVDPDQISISELYKLVSRAR